MPDVLVVTSEGETVSLPSGTLTAPRVTREFSKKVFSGTKSQQEWLWFLQETPGGVVNIDPNDVIANVEIVPVDPLPGMAGIAEMVQSGALTRIEDGYGSSDNYAIEKYVRLPSGLRRHGRAVNKFILKHDVPAPASGELQSICIIAEKDGKPINPDCS